MPQCKLTTIGVLITVYVIDALCGFDEFAGSTVSSAIFRPEVPGCLEGTRVAILEELEKWATNPRGPQVYWLNGHAGSGKSRIAQTFAKFLSSQSKLGASFFCDRNLQDRSDIKKIMSTLTSQLAATGRFKVPLVQELVADTSIDISTSLTLQINRLLLALAKNSSLSTIILIDALDECNAESTSTFLSLLVPSLSQIPSTKFFITSRRAGHIEAYLSGSCGGAVEDKRLHEVDAIEDDIKLFINTELQSLRSDCARARLEIPLDWPGKDKTDALAQKAGKSFIFASAAVQAIKDPQYNPVLRLDQLISSETRDLDDNPYVELDELHLHILNDAFPSENTQTSTLRSILGLLAVAQRPLCPATIAELLSIEESTVVPILQALYAVISSPPDQVRLVAFYHKSLIDFLTQRCSDPRFRIHVDEHHFETARRSPFGTGLMLHTRHTSREYEASFPA